MSKVLFWIVVAPMAAAIIVFSVNNRSEVILDLWPLDTVPMPVPVYALALVALAAGFLAGGVVAWYSAGKSRKRARTEARRANQSERDLAPPRTASNVCNPRPPCKSPRKSWRNCRPLPIEMALRQP